MKFRVAMQLDLVDNGVTAVEGVLSFGEYYDKATKQRVLYIKTHDGSVIPIATENTKKVIDMIKNLVEVNEIDSTGYQPKLTYLVKKDSGTGTYFYGDDNIKKFNTELNSNLEKYKPYIQHVTYEGNEITLTPFLNDKTVMTTISIRQDKIAVTLQDIIIQLIEYLYGTNVQLLESTMNVFDDLMKAFDQARLTDANQNGLMLNQLELLNRIDVLIQLINNWLAEAEPIIAQLPNVYTIDTRGFSSAYLVYVLITSINTNDPPILDGIVTTSNVPISANRMMIQFTRKGLLMSMHIDGQTGASPTMYPPLTPAQTLLVRGGGIYYLYSNSEYIRISLATGPVASIGRPNLNHSDYHNMLATKDQFHWIYPDSQKTPYTITTTGTPENSGVIGYVNNWLWRTHNPNMRDGRSLDNYEALVANTDIYATFGEGGGYKKNTRVALSMTYPLQQIKANFQQITIGIDVYYALSGLDGDGGFRGVQDLTGRLSWYGYGVRGNPVASVPDARVAIPKNMTVISDTYSCHRVITIPTSNLDISGGWNLIFQEPNGGNHGCAINTTRRKGRNFSSVQLWYYLRARDANTFEILVRYNQICDGDSGNNVEGQTAGRLSALIYGYKSNTIKAQVRNMISSVAELEVNTKTSMPSSGRALYLGSKTGSGSVFVALKRTRPKTRTVQVVDHKAGITWWIGAPFIYAGLRQLPEFLSTTNSTHDDNKFSGIIEAYSLDQVDYGTTLKMGFYHYIGTTFDYHNYCRDCYSCFDNCCDCGSSGNGGTRSARSLIFTNFASNTSESLTPDGSRIVDSNDMNDDLNGILSRVYNEEVSAEDAINDIMGVSEVSPRSTRSVTTLAATRANSIIKMTQPLNNYVSVGDLNNSPIAAYIPPNPPDVTEELLDANAPFVVMLLDTNTLTTAWTQIFRFQVTQYGSSAFGNMADYPSSYITCYARWINNRLSIGYMYEHYMNRGAGGRGGYRQRSNMKVTMGYIVE